MRYAIHTLLARTAHAQRNFLRPHLKELGLSPGQSKALRELAALGPLSQRELAEYYEINPAAVSRMLDALERNGFVTRRRDQASRRRDLVEITEKGRAAHGQWEERCQELECVMLSDFTAEERRQFCDYLARAHRNLHSTKEDRRNCRRSSFCQ